jgi:arginyl-tRNA synthetase
LRDKVIEKVLEEMKDREMEDKDKIAKSVGIGAMKYGMLKVSPEKVIFFDWEEALRLEGNTGPYLQYAFTRCSGILRKSKKWKSVYKVKELNEHEIALVKSLSRFSQLVEQSSNELKPNHVCNYVYDLATAFNNFYENCPVMKAENEHLKNFRLTLVDATRTVLKTALNLIGIEAVEKM